MGWGILLLNCPESWVLQRQAGSLSWKEKLFGLWWSELTTNVPPCLLYSKISLLTEESAATVSEPVAYSRDSSASLLYSYSSQILLRSVILQPVPLLLWRNHNNLRDFAMIPKGYICVPACICIITNFLFSFYAKLF